jgi:hypothetical protein
MFRILFARSRFLSIAIPLHFDLNSVNRFASLLKSRQYQIHTFKMAARTATVSRETSETSISCTLTLDNAPGVQKIEVSTGLGFLDHVHISSLIP